MNAGFLPPDSAILMEGCRGKSNVPWHWEGFFLWRCQDWIFAKDNYFLSNCGLTLSIQNSSNPKLNGEYFQEDRFHGCRPVFHCRGKQQYLFYNSSKKQWQIYKKLSASLGRRGNPLVQWSVVTNDCFFRADYTILLE